MLERQLACWSGYPSSYRIVLVDDSSPRFPAVDVVRGSSVEVYRIAEDIPWNFTGARNLGCSVCQGWIYVSDIDTLLPATDACRLFEVPQPGSCYIPNRVNFSGGRPRRRSIVNLLFERTAFDAAGGYDEDYAGFYGREEWDFFNRLSRVAAHVYRDDVTVHCVPPYAVPDAATAGLSRDWSRNTALYLSKRSQGFPRPAAGLRFAWSRVH